MDTDEVVGLKYTGTALPESTDTETVFDTTKMIQGNTTSAFESFKHFLAMTGLRWFRYSIWNSHAGTLNFYRSTDGGTNWRRFKTTAVAAASGDANEDDVLVEAHPDFKVEWVNGGTNQTTFDIAISLARRT